MYTSVKSPIAIPTRIPVMIARAALIEPKYANDRMIAVINTMAPDI